MGSNLPSPSKSPAIGVSPDPPSAKLMPLRKPAADLRTYHTPVDGRYTAISVLPSPSKSPATGTSARSPHPLVRLDTYPVVDVRIVHRPVLGRKVATSA